MAIHHARGCAQAATPIAWTRTTRRMRRVERFADNIFLLALLFMVAICGFITYALAIR